MNGSLSAADAVESGSSVFCYAPEYVRTGGNDHVVFMDEAVGTVCVEETNKEDQTSTKPAAGTTTSDTANSKGAIKGPGLEESENGRQAAAASPPTPLKTVFSEILPGSRLLLREW